MLLRAQRFNRKELAEYFLFAQALHVANELLNTAGLKVKAFLER